MTPSPASTSAAAAHANDSVRIVNPLDDPAWDEKISRFPAATIFHTSAWARVLHETYRYEPLYCTLTSGNRFTAVLPLMEVDSWLTGRRGISLPFTDESPALYDSKSDGQQLYSTALALANERRWKYLELRGGQELVPSALPAVSFWCHSLELGSDPATCFARLDSGTRRAVRKAQQSSLVTEVSQSMAAMHEFYRLVGITRRRHGLPPQPVSFFKNIQRRLLAPGAGRIVLVRSSGVAIAGAVFFHFGRKALYKFGASDESFQHLRPNNLVMWTAIEQLAQEGFASLDFGRTSLANEGLRKFKLGWGTSEHRQTYVRYDLRQAAFVTENDHSSGWHTQIFSRLPAPLSRMTGTMLYRHIA